MKSKSERLVFMWDLIRRERRNGGDRFSEGDANIKLWPCFVFFLLSTDSRTETVSLCLSFQQNFGLRDNWFLRENFGSKK